MRIEVDCERLRRNTETIVQMCAAHDVEVVGVTKACLRPPRRRPGHAGGRRRACWPSRGWTTCGGCARQALECPSCCCACPRLSEVGEVVQLTQVSLNSQVETVRALSRAAQAHGVTHQVILMIETGDRREGVMPERALEVARGMVGLPHVELAGMGTNVTCIGGVLPTRENTQRLLDVAEEIERALRLRFRIISAGNSATLALLLRDEMPARANQLRIGGAILIGEVDSTGDWPSALPHQDAFAVAAEVIEVETKPSVPEGPVAPNAFGQIHPTGTDRGCGGGRSWPLGRQDVQIESLVPRRPGVTIVGASSDHLVRGRDRGRPARPPGRGAGVSATGYGRGMASRTQPGRQTTPLGQLQRRHRSVAEPRLGVNKNRSRPDRKGLSASLEESPCMGEPTRPA